MYETARRHLTIGVKSRDVRDWAVVLALAAAVMAVVAHSPSTTLVYAQIRHIGAVISVAQGGDWLLPRCPTRGLFHKPPLAIWAGAAAVKATGLYDDFVFRLPTVLAFFAVVGMVYWLGRRWYGNRVGMMAACLWATTIHMSKVSYLALTDMMFTAFFTGSVLCADRLLFHPQGVRRRWAWAVGLWATIILGAMTKGWGLVNAALLGAMMALASAVGPDFRAVPSPQGLTGKVLSAIRRVLRRWRQAARDLYFTWGLIATLLVVGSLVAGMVVVGGEEFRQTVYKEVWQRLTGAGEAPPRATTVPAFIQLLYYQFPASVFAVGALFLARREEWLARRALLLPACWILAVLVPFSLSHGFRPDYLLPCYGAMALMGAWAIERLWQIGPQAGRRFSAVRHVFAAAPVLLGAALVLVPLAYGLSGRGGETVRQAFRDPQTLDTLARWLLVAAAPAGVVVIGLSVQASLNWRIYRLGGLAALASLGFIFLYTHTLSEHARSLDGEKMIRFTRAAKRMVGDGPVALCGAEQVGVHLYLGTTRWWLLAPSDLHRGLSNPALRWLVISDAALARAAESPHREDSPEGQGPAPSPWGPESLGAIRVRTSGPIAARHTGNLYLIEVSRPPDGRTSEIAPPKTDPETGGRAPRQSGTRV